MHESVGNRKADAGDQSGKSVEPQEVWALLERVGFANSDGHTDLSEFAVCEPTWPNSSSAEQINRGSHVRGTRRRNRRRLPSPASSEAGKAMPRPGRGFQGGRMT
jgi:hypothetical protein